MSSYNVALFIHLLGVITLFGAIALQQRAGVRLRTSYLSHVTESAWMNLFVTRREGPSTAVDRSRWVSSA
jgi:hypothetical protein